MLVLIVHCFCSGLILKKLTYDELIVFFCNYFAVKQTTLHGSSVFYLSSLFIHISFVDMFAFGKLFVCFFLSRIIIIIIIITIII